MIKDTQPYGQYLATLAQNEMVFYARSHQAEVVVQAMAKYELRDLWNEIRERVGSALVRHGGLNAEVIPRPTSESHVRVINWWGHDVEEPGFSGMVFTDGSFYPCSAAVGRRAGWAIVQWDEDPRKRFGMFGNVWAPVRQSSGSGEWLGYAVGQQKRVGPAEETLLRVDYKALERVHCWAPLKLLNHKRLHTTFLKGAVQDTGGS